MRAIAVRLLLTVTAMLAGERAVEACTCWGSLAERTISPARGTVGFPVDGSIRIFMHGYDEPLRTRIHREYRLAGPDRALVPLKHEVHDLMVVLTPGAPLRPNTRYVLERVFAYDRGLLLSESERLELARGGRNGVSQRRYWLPDIWFETGEGIEHSPPRAPRIVQAEALFDDSSCGPATWVSAKVGAAEIDAPVLALEIDGVGIVRHFDVGALGPNLGSYLIGAGNLS